jgi:hypothetical protein
MFNKSTNDQREEKKSKELDKVRAIYFYLTRLECVVDVGRHKALSAAASGEFLRILLIYDK